jgi:hypothetical protein
MEEADLLNNGQYGFRRNRFCLSQLLLHHHRLVAVMAAWPGLMAQILSWLLSFLAWWHK